MVVAVPYYGPLVRPLHGVEKVFFLASLEPISGQVFDVALKVWNPREYPEMHQWMKRQHVSGVVCSDRHPGIESELEGRGIWVASGHRGEAQEMIRQWHAGRRAAA